MNAHGCAHACHGTQSASASGSVVGGVHGAVSGNMTANSMRIRFGTVLRRGRANICALWFAHLRPCNPKQSFFRKTQDNRCHWDGRAMLWASHAG